MIQLGRFLDELSNDPKKFFFHFFSKKTELVGYSPQKIIYKKFYLNNYFNYAYAYLALLVQAWPLGQARSITDERQLTLSKYKVVSFYRLDFILYFLN